MTAMKVLQNTKPKSTGYKAHLVQTYGHKGHNALNWWEFPTEVQLTPLIPE